MGRPRKRPRDQPLQVAVKGGLLVMSIGVETLAFAVEHAPGPPLTTYDEGTEDFVHTRVTDADEFAYAVRTTLLAEEEDGSTALTRMLDEASERAICEGCEGVDHGDESDEGDAAAEEQP